MILRGVSLGYHFRLFMGTSLCYCTFHNRHHPGWILWKKSCKKACVNDDMTSLDVTLFIDTSPFSHWIHADVWCLQTCWFLFTFFLVVGFCSYWLSWVFPDAVVKFYFQKNENNKVSIWLFHALKWGISIMSAPEIEGQNWGNKHSPSLSRRCLNGYFWEQKTQNALIW